VADNETHLLVTQIKSTIATKPVHRGTLRALGLRRIGMSNALPDRPEIRGMLHRVSHLVTVDEMPGAPTPAVHRSKKKASS
jgi:large subunit ribosomal protein L30